MLPVYWQQTIDGKTTRRELLRIGGLSLLGLSATELAQRRAVAAPNSETNKRRRNSCVFIFLFGGPSHIDLWDMKPNAPAEVRGDFKPAATRVPGIQICEHLPHLASQMDKVCLLRSYTHRNNVHGPACSEVFSGRDYIGPPTDEASREDWPSLSSLVMRFGPPGGGVPPSVVLPWYIHFGGMAKLLPGQTGARMGDRYNALLIQGDLSRADFELQGFKLAPDTPDERIQARRRLLSRLEVPVGAGHLREKFDGHRDSVYRLLETRAGDIFDLNQEPPAVRDRYGRTAFGQSLLLARRVIEAGVPLVTINWDDETKVDGVNTCWDTHQNIFSKLKNHLCPLFDKPYAAFIEDLHTRGLLETTLVTATGEFGRTPRLGQFSQSSNTNKTGRDHWPHAQTVLLAGGGVRGGQVYGETTSNGGYIKDKPVTPGDLTATIFHHLGIDHKQLYVDEFQKLPRKLSDGVPITDLG